MCGEDKDETKEEIKTEKPPRPLNSYLKVVLDDKTMNRLHRIAVKLGKDIQTMSNDKLKNGDTKTTKEKALKFRWRSRNSLHLTLFFGGAVLSSMSPDELIRWHTNVKERLGKSKFVLDSEPLQSSASTSIVLDESPVGPEELERDEYWFRIRALSLFPPGRNYLIVALLEASPAWHALYKDIRNVAINGDSEALKSLAKSDRGEGWIPHITLGNLYGGRKGRALDEVRTMLQDFPLVENEEFSLEEEALSTGKFEGDNGEIDVKCITMGGPVPQQVELDWNFQNHRK